MMRNLKTMLKELTKQYPENERYAYSLNLIERLDLPDEGDIDELIVEYIKAIHDSLNDEEKQISQRIVTTLLYKSE